MMRDPRLMQLIELPDFYITTDFKIVRKFENFVAIKRDEITLSHVEISVGIWKGPV